MSAGRFLRPLRYGVAPLAICIALQPLGARAGVENGAGAARQSGRVLAQAVAEPRKQAATSPYMVPAPRLFEATGTAVWDGRRTLQGIWVAHPLATTARRVRIFDTENGAAVDGALFRRDPSLTGPDVLISSEAAKILGMSPNEAVELRIVALTPEKSAGSVTEIPRPGASAVATGSGGDAGAAAGEQAAAGTQSVGSAEAAVSGGETASAITQAAAPAEAPAEQERAAAATPETGIASAPEAQSASGPATPTAARAEASPSHAEQRAAVSEPAPQPAPEPEAAAPRNEPPASLAMTATTASEAQTPGPLDSWSSLLPAENAGQEPAAGTPGAAEAPQSRDAAPPAAVAMLVAPAMAAPSVTPAAPEGSFRQSEPAPGRPALPATARPSGERIASVGPDRTFRLEEPAPAGTPPSKVKPPVSKPTASAEPDWTSRPDEPASQRMASAAPAGKATPPAAASPLDKPYVQAGLFGVAGNATRLIARIEAADLPALGKPMTLDGRPVTRVLAGPFATVAERAAALRIIRRMGLADALPVAR